MSCKNRSAATVRMKPRVFVQMSVRRLARNIVSGSRQTTSFAKRYVRTLLGRFIVDLYLLQGSKIRSTYIAFAQKEKKRLEEEIASSAQEILTREKEVARLKGVPSVMPLGVSFPQYRSRSC